MATIADLVATTLVNAGVERIWGVTGDSLNGLSDSLRRIGKIAWMHVRHEEVAAFAAGAEAATTGRLAVCAGSCGPGNLHLINGLFNCHRNHEPVLAIAAHIPSSEIGLALFPGNAPAGAVQGMQLLRRAGLDPGADAARAGDGDAHRHPEARCRGGGAARQRGARAGARRRCRPLGRGRPSAHGTDRSGTRQAGGDPQRRRRR